MRTRKFSAPKNFNFFPVPSEITFPSVDSFCFNEIDVHFPDERDQSEFESIKRKHTDTIVGLLSKRTLNNRDVITSNNRIDFIH